MDMTPKLAIRLNALALYAVSAVLVLAFYWQLVYDEVPCPLCLLQRVALTGLAVGPILTIRHGPRPANYGLVIIAALMGAAIAARQILLHIMPGDAGFGSAFLGLHFYTWAFLCFVGAILWSAVMLTFGRQFAPQPNAPTATRSRASRCGWSSGSPASMQRVRCSSAAFPDARPTRFAMSC